MSASTSDPTPSSAASLHARPPRPAVRLSPLLARGGTTRGHADRLLLLPLCPPVLLHLRT